MPTMQLWLVIIPSRYLEDGVRLSVVRAGYAHIAERRAREKHEEFIRRCGVGVVRVCSIAKMKDGWNHEI